MGPSLDKPRPTIGMVAKGTRRAMEFRIVVESTVSFVGPCGEGRAEPFIFPVQDLGSNQTTPTTRPLFKLTPNLFSKLSALHPCPSSPRKPSVVGIRIRNPNPGKLPFPPTLAFTPCRHGPLPGLRGSFRPPLSSDRPVCPFLESIQMRYIRSTLLSHPA